MQAVAPQRVEPQVATAANPHPERKVAAGLPSRRLTSVASAVDIQSIKLDSVALREPEKLTDQRLKEIWANLLEDAKAAEPKLYDLIADKVVTLEDGNHFNIEVPSLFFDTLLLDFRTYIHKFFRNATNNDSIQYRTIVKVEKKAAVVYDPKEKFDVMMNENPAMLSLRKLFPEIEL